MCLDLVDNHPGGFQGIAAWAGRDATAEFQQTHPTNWEDLLQQMTVVGHVVPRLDPGYRPAPNQVQLDCWVYELDRDRYIAAAMAARPQLRDQALASDEGFEWAYAVCDAMFVETAAHAGKTYAELSGDNEWAAALRVLDRLVVAQVAPAPGNTDRMRDVTQGELAANCSLGEMRTTDVLRMLAEPDPEVQYYMTAQMPRGSMWVSIRGVVYDVTGRFVPLQRARC